MSLIHFESIFIYSSFLLFLLLSISLPFFLSFHGVGDQTHTLEYDKQALLIATPPDVTALPSERQGSQVSIFPV